MNRKNQRMLSIALLSVLIITLGVVAPVSVAHAEDTRIIYVRANAEDDGDGTTWDTAYNDLQDALAKAKSIEKGSKVHIWVAEGMYKPGGKRNASFRMLNNVSIFGGFPEDGGDWEERDWEEHETILSGDIGKSGKDDDNCYHVLYNAKVDNTAILDGFTITGGYAKPTFIGLQVTGGGVYNESASPTFCNVNINGNFALAFGGGMYNDRSDPVLTNVTITDNRSLGSGGGIFNKKSDPALNGVAISENDSLLRGGGMHNSNSDPVLTNVTFHDNNCSGLGGGLYNEDSNLVITDSEFSENSSRNGGGIYSQGSEVTLTGVKFISNEADSISGWEFVGNGGAVYCFGGTLSCTETEFHFNSANSDGGAIHNLGGDLDLKDVSFANNTAGVFPREVVAAMARWKYPQANGGAIYSYGSCKIDGAEFDHNQAKDNGGAIYFGLSGGLNALELSNAIFTGNSAEQDGGAVHATLASLVDSVFSGNSAHRGGGLALTQWGGIVNSTFAANTATQCGGGLYTSFLQPTLAEYEVEGDAPAPESSGGGNGILVNTILWGNEAEEGAQIHNQGGRTTVGNCLIQGSGGSGENWDTSLGWDEDNNLDSDPRFVSNPSIEPNPEDWPNNDYGNLRLKVNSPAINSGDNYWVAGIPTDLDGKPRVVREVVDIGAYEFQAGSPAPKPDPEPQVEHLGGRDRIRTAVAISKDGWEQSDYVVLARNDAYPDALAGVPLAYLYDAPILLTDSDDLPTVTRTEIRRLGAKKVFILGGAAAISQDVRHELSDMGLTVQRVGGRNRFATAALIADQVAPKGADQVVLANGETFADAISVAAYAANKGLPILLTTRDTLPEETSKALDELNVSSILVIGGEAVIADATVKKIGNYLRLFGDDRYGTAVAVANYINPENKRVLLATGLEFADALTGAALAAKEGCGLFLLDDEIPDGIMQYLKDKEIIHFTILGGTEAVGKRIEGQLLK